MPIGLPAVVVVGIEIRFNVITLEWKGHVNVQVLPDGVGGYGNEPFRFEFTGNDLATIFNLILAFVQALEV